MDHSSNPDPAGLEDALLPLRTLQKGALALPGGGDLRLRGASLPKRGPGGPPPPLAEGLIPVYLEIPALEAAASLVWGAGAGWAGEVPGVAAASAPPTPALRPLRGLTPSQTTHSQSDRYPRA